MLNMTRFHCPKIKTLLLALFSIKQNVSHISDQSHIGLRSGENLGKIPEWGLQLSFRRPKSPSVTSGSSWICLNHPWGTVEGGNPAGVAAEDSGVPLLAEPWSAPCPPGCRRSSITTGIWLNTSLVIYHMQYCTALVALFIVDQSIQRVSELGIYSVYPFWCCGPEMEEFSIVNPTLTLIGCQRPTQFYLTFTYHMHWDIILKTCIAFHLRL